MYPNIEIQIFVKQNSIELECQKSSEITHLIVNFTFGVFTFIQLGIASADNCIMFYITSAIKVSFSITPTELTGVRWYM